jgi:hypothetical protein
VTDEEYKEPDNEQLAQFMVIYAPRLVGEQHDFQLNPIIIERLISQKPEFRAAALRHHKQFYDEAKDLFKKLERGQLRCLFVRENGKRCVNFNVPGSFYCGIESHNAEVDEEPIVP